MMMQRNRNRITIMMLPSLLLVLATATAAAFAPAAFGRRTHAVAGHGLFESQENEDNIDIEELNRRIADLSDPYGKLFRTTAWDQRPKPSNVHIILFNPDTIDEGVHTVEYPIGSGSNAILAFESADECANFATMLKSQNFYDPNPQPMELRSLEEYCAELGVLVKVVPRGMDLLPPTAVVDQLSHNPNLTEEKKELTRIFESSASDVVEAGTLPVVGDGFSGDWD